MTPTGQLRVVLTGSSAGIGHALAGRLILRGHLVWGVARSDQSVVPAGWQTGPGDFRSSRCDIADWPAMERVAAEVAQAWPHVDAVIACAGWQGEVGPTLTADPARWHATVRANLEGTFNTLRAFHASLARAPRHAKAVCFSGGGATKARPNFSAYGAAKTGIVRLVETIATETPTLDINAVAPGAINTRMTDELIAHGPAATGEVEHAAALQQKETGGASLTRVLDLVEFLLSPASDGISGRLISAPWDPWEQLAGRQAELAASDIYKLRRLVHDGKSKP